MPRFTCPNCHKAVRVQPYQFGKVLRCPKCRGRFLADPGLPPDIHVQNYSGEAPPLPDMPSADAGGWQQTTELPAPPSRPRWSEYGEPANRSHRGGWLMFAAWFAVEFAIGFMIGYAETNREWSYLLQRYRYPLWESRAFVNSLSFLVLVDFVLFIVTMFYIARAGRRSRDSAAGWIILTVLAHSVGLALFLFSRPRDHDLEVLSS
jgi:hypothetical protein